MKKLNIYSIIALIIAFFAQGIVAQESKPTDDTRIKNLESAISKLPKISGFVNIRHQYSDEAGSYAKGKNGFDIRRAYFEVKGTATQTVGYRLLVDFAGTPKILDAYAEWKPIRNLSIRGGQFKIPFTLENPYSPTELETIDNSLAVTDLVTDIAGNKNNGRDVGVQVVGALANRGDYSLVDYKVGIFNGNLINTTDNNTTKDVIASLSINPLKALSINGSFYKGEYGAQATKGNRQRVSAGVKYDNQKLLFRSEYLFGKTTGIESKGIYAVLGYFVTPTLQPVLKYDNYNSDINFATSKAKSQYTAGINYYLTKLSRVQFNYVRTDYDNSTLKDANAFTTQLFVTF